MKEVRITGFKIGFAADDSENRVSDYKRVIGLAETDVHGRFFHAGSHFVTFDRATLPQSKIITWYKAPGKIGQNWNRGSMIR